jgi:nucleoside-diphosphate-sugar epimerase
MDYTPGKEYDTIRGQRVLVTGGLGFCGSNLTRFLAERLDCRVTVIDDLSNSTLPDRTLRNVEVVVADVRDLAAYQSHLETNPWIFHLACRTILTCSADPEGDLSVNATGTLRLLEWLRHQAPPKFQRFLYTSSTSIYGNCRHLPADELDPPHILNHYAATKLLGEQYTLLYHMAYGVPTTCVRYSNVYGPGQTMSNPYCGVIGKFLDAAASGQALTIHGDGEQTRDYTFVDDVVEATVLAALSPKALGDVFNIGTGVETSVNTIAHEMRTIFGNGVRIEHVDRRDIDNIRRRALSPEKIRMRLGWSPQVRFRDGLRRTIEQGWRTSPLNAASADRRTAPR